MCRPIALWWMLRMSESQESMQSPGIVDVIAAEAGGGWMCENVMVTLHWTVDTCLHSPHADC